MVYKHRPRSSILYKAVKFQIGQALKSMKNSRTKTTIRRIALPSKPQFKSIFVRLLIVFSGLASTQIYAATTDLVLATSTDSEKTTGRHYTVTRYTDTSCSKPKKNSKLLRKKFAKDTHEFAPIKIATGELFVFQVNYEEKRRDSERLCAASLGFTPQEGRLYRAEYQVSGQVSRCEIAVYDITEEKQLVEADVKPEYSCAKRGKNGNKNGVPSHSFIERF